MTVALIGSGAMASLLAARLASLTEVVMVGSWRPQIEAVAQNGLWLEEADGRRHHFPTVRATDQPEQVEPVKLAFILVKSWQTAVAAQRTAQLLQPDGLAITLQNGWGHLEILTAVLGADRVTAGVTSEGANLLEPGVVRHAGRGATYLGYMDDGRWTIDDHIVHRPSSLVEEAADLLRRAGFDVCLEENLNGLIWRKLVVSSAINPLTALLRVVNGELLARPSAHRLMRLLAEETAVVAHAAGIKLPPGDPAVWAEEVAAATAPNRSSMLQDIERGGPTEIEAISGAIARQAAAAQTAAPLNQVMRDLVTALDDGRWTTNDQRLTTN
jgi:2-dehydropantoate 2-reductase